MAAYPVAEDDEREAEPDDEDERAAELLDDEAGADDELEPAAAELDELAGAEELDEPLALLLPAAPRLKRTNDERHKEPSEDVARKRQN